MSGSNKAIIILVMMGLTVGYLYCLFSGAISGLTHRKPECTGNSIRIDVSALRCNRPHCKDHPEWSIRLGKWLGLAETD